LAAALQADVPVVDGARSKHGLIADISVGMHALLYDEDIAEMPADLLREEPVIR